MKDEQGRFCSTHGMTGTRIHNTWRSIKRRCYTKSHIEYKRYGAKGITVCDEWKNDFQVFYDWAMNNGYREDLTIDRIDNNKGYSPSNCRWVTQKDQQNNRSNNHYITYNGKTQTAKQWAEELNINHSTIITRLSRNWTIERTLSTP